MKIRLLMLLCYTLLLLLLLLLLLSACNNNDEIQNIETNMYEFKEPTKFPFEVNEVSTRIDLETTNSLYQLIFRYRNNETTQEIDYSLSKGIEQPKDDTSEYKLKNGLIAYYEETPSSQSIWWVNENGFLSRFDYIINGNATVLGENKLSIDELVKLANEVQ
jgi:type VI protein secretion system component VasK